jgi:VWFA-related protein
VPRIPLTAAILALLLTTQPTNAQQQAPPITVTVNVVSLLATVRDKHGALVNNLSKDDFLLDQDGKPQQITYFTKESDLPLTLGLLIDTSMSQRHVLDQELNASRSFLDHMLREDKDKAFVIHFDREVQLDQELTSSREKLQTAINQINSPNFGHADSDSSSSNGGSNGGGYGGGRGGRGGRGGSAGGNGGGTLLYDAVFLASDEIMKKQQGRKALIVLTDGVDRHSKETIEQAIETAQRANTLVYCILFADKESYGNNGGYGGHHGGRGGGYPPRGNDESRPDGKKVLQEIAKTTGARFFEVSKKEPIDRIYTAIDEELRHQYSLAYNLDRAATPTGYHHLQLTTKPKDLVVQTRDGFYLDR